MQFTSFPRKIHSGDTRDAMRDVRDFDQELRKLIKSGGSGNRRYQETIEERDRVVRYASAWRRPQVRRP